MKISRKKQLSILAAFIAIIIAGGAMYWWHSHRNAEAETTSKTASAQNNYKGDGRHTVDGQSNNTSQGGAVDNRGDNDNTASGGVSSKSGLVTVLSPVQDGIFMSGSTLRGRANNITKVQYRVVDDNVGVIATGALDVVGGTFSGTMQFMSNGTSGRVDIFTYNNNYNEENSVQIPVRFKD